MINSKKLPSSFRDPAGHVFKYNGIYYRTVNHSYKRNFDHFILSKLKETLVRKGLMLDFNVMSSMNKKVFDPSNSHYKILKPQQLDFISFPYEWSFSQLKEAALLTLNIQKVAIDYKMTLKDASLYNIQFVKNKPIFIDHLSFEEVRDDNFIWNAYKQFCQHFLAPLLLMSKKDINLFKLLITYIDGIPLDLASKLLPISSYFNYGIFAHIHLHSKSLNLNSDARKKTNKTYKLSKFGHLGILNSLEKLIKKLFINKNTTEWGNYYSDTNYIPKSFKHKAKIINKITSSLKISSLVDLGGNNGNFSRALQGDKIEIFCLDIDPIAIDKNYLINKKNKIRNITPLVFDIANPTPSIGFMNNERSSLTNRLPKVQCLMALAVIHHLYINNNLSFTQIYDLFSHFSSKYIIVEFVEKSDSQVQRLLKARNNKFENYNKENFISVFSKKSKIKDIIPIKDSERIIYVFEKK